jgi:zinc transporter ZupT
VGVMMLLLQHSPRYALPQRRQLRALAYAILISFAAYAGTVIGVFWHPVFGALMLPKTMAYVAVVWLLYTIEFRAVARQESAEPALYS